MPRARCPQRPVASAPHHGRHQSNATGTCRGAGLSVIGYSFANPYAGNGTAAQQAQYLVSHATVGGKVAPLMLDIEYNPYVSQEANGNECYSLTPVAMVNWIFQFVGEVQSLTGQLPIIYTPHDWWITCTGNSTAFYQDPLWLPDYSTTDTSPPLMADWANWSLWQYTSSGAVPGISGNTDLDQLNPAVVALLAPGVQRSMVGTAVTPVTVNAFTVPSGPALAYKATGLPPGLSIDSSSGQISGVPASAGNYQVTVTATGVTGTGTATGFVRITWQVRGKVTVTSPGAKSTVAGGPVDLQILAADSAPNEQALKYSATGLPAGLTISSQGLITGWPASPAGTHSVTVTATDGLSDSGSASFTWTVSAAPGTGAAGLVHLDLASKCLTDTGNSSANGAKIETWSCNGTTPQVWTFAQDNTLRMHGKCLTAAGLGAKAVLETCSGAISQQWRPGTGSELLNPAYGVCLDDSHASTANGSAVDAWSCTGKANQKWTLPAGPVVSQIAGNCLDNTANSTANGNPIEIWTCNGGGTQKWTAEPDGTVRILGKCLDASAPATGSALVLDGCTSGSAAQLWAVLTDGAGVQLQNPQSGLCVADPLDATAKGTHLVIGACSTADPGVDWRVR